MQYVCQVVWNVKTRNKERWMDVDNVVVVQSINSAGEMIWQTRTTLTNAIIADNDFTSPSYYEPSASSCALVSDRYRRFSSAFSGSASLDFMPGPAAANAASECGLLCHTKAIWSMDVHLNYQHCSVLCTIVYTIDDLAYQHAHASSSYK